MKKKKSGSVIITRQEHGISRKLMNPNALRILYRLRDNGYVGYLVGGCVRDLREYLECQVLIYRNYQFKI